MSGEFACLKDLSAAGSGLEDLLRAAGKSLAKAGEPGVLQLRVNGGVEGEDEIRLTLVARKKKVEVEADYEGRPEMVVITSAEVARRVFCGDYSPLQAFLDGKLRFGGDANRATRMLRALAETPTARCSICDPEG